MNTDKATALELAVVEHTDCACTVCGCVCDDLTIQVEHGRVTRVDRACDLAKPFFERIKGLESDDLSRPTVARVRGVDVAYEEAVRESAAMLMRSRAPLFFGLSRSTTSGQRAAVKLADRLGANIDTTASVCHGPSIMAIQQVGESTSSLGEVRHRADLVIFWGADPMVTHPRHFERYSVDPAGLFVPGGRADRHVVVVDTKPTESARLADTFLQVEPGKHFEAICALRTCLKGLDLPAETNVGLPTDQIRSLVERMKSCRYGVVFFGLGLAQTDLGHANVEALLSLVAEMNAFSRFTARRLRIPGDVTGADLVLCWQTGFPFAVNLARGYPRYNPGEYTANELLERREVDLCLVVGSDSLEKLSDTARCAVREVPTIFLDYPTCDPPCEPTVQFRTAIYGIHAAGTAYRMDEVPIPLRQLLPRHHPTDDMVLDAITAHCHA